MIKAATRFLLVKDSEYGKLIYFFGVFLLIGGGMALGRGTTDALFFKRYGIEYLPVMYMIVSVMLLLVTTTYAAFADRFPAEKFFNVLFLGGAILLFIVWWIVTRTESSFIYPVYFIIYEVGSELLPIHAALYLSQNMDTLQAKRLSPLIFAGAQIGAIAGGILLAILAPVIGAQNILMLWGVVFLVSIFLMRMRHAKTGVSHYFRAPKKDAGHFSQAVTQVVQGIKFTRDSSLLRAASFALFFMVVAFYVLCYSVNRIYTETFTTEDSLTAFFGILTAVNSTLALLLQVFVTNKIIHRFGVKKINLMFPITSLVSFGALLLNFALPSAILGSLNKDTIMTAFRNPVRNMFFNALPGYMQGRARAMSVAFVMPLALVVGGGVLWIVQRLDHPAYYLSAGIMAALCYLYFNIKMNKAYASEIVLHLKEKLFLPKDAIYADLSGGQDEVYSELVKGVDHPDEELVIVFSKALIKSFPDKAPGIILARMDRATPATKDVLMRLLAPLSPPDYSNYLRNAYETGDDHLKSTILRILIDRDDEQVLASLPRLLKEDNPRLNAMGIYGVIRQSIGQSRNDAINAWKHLLQSDKPEFNLAGLSLFDVIPGEDVTSGLLDVLVSETIPHLLEQDNTHILLESLSILSRQQHVAIDNIDILLSRIYVNPDYRVRKLCVQCYQLLPENMRIDTSGSALEDSHPAVRSAALDIIKRNSSNLNEQLSWWLAVENKGSPRAQQTMLEALLEHGAPVNIMEMVASAKIIEGISISHALRLLHKHQNEVDTRITLLIYVLEERRHELIDLALLAMNAIEDRDMLGVIRAGIQSGDVRHMANACEALKSMDNQKLAGFLGDIIQYADGGTTRKSVIKAPFSDIKGVLKWCQELRDPWLRECSEYVLQAH